MGDSISALLAAAGAGQAAVEAVIGAVGAATIAELVTAELVERAELADAPAAVIRLLLDSTEAPVERLIPVGRPTLANPGSSSVEQPGPVRATVRQDLAELVCEVYGRPAGPPATRQITWDDDTPIGPHSEVPAIAPTVHRLLAGSTDLADDLGTLALRFGSDKWGLHYYTPLYERYLRPYQHAAVTLLEIGVGGFGHAGFGGGSLRMWQRYFRRGQIYGIDIATEQVTRYPRVETFIGDQTDAGFLAQVLADIGSPDIIIDDGSHRSADVLASFAMLFSRLRPGGLYFIEDLQTSYWPSFGGSCEPGTATTTEFLKQLVDDIHYEERPGELPGDPELGRQVTGLHVHHNLAVIEKGANSEGSLPRWHPARA